MGYYAHVQSLVVNGEQADWPIILQRDRLDAVYAELVNAESVIGTHISWCQPLAELSGTLAEQIASIFDQYGFEETSVDDDGNVAVMQWGSSKIGSCWDQMIAALSAGVNPDDEIILFMIGEDYESWAEIITGGEFRSASTKMTIHNN